VIVIDAYRDRKVAVLGLGRTGLSAVRSLVAGGAEVLAWDDDPNRRAAAVDHGARAVAPDRDGWAGIAALVLSPGIPLTHPAPHIGAVLADSLGAEILGDVELFARTRPDAAVVAITGTNGKSTTTALVGHVLRSAGRQVELGANLGRPVLDFDRLPTTGIYVLELSSYQIDLVRSLRPAVSALINMSPDHLDRHGGMDGYVAAKRRLLEMTGPSAMLVIGVDDEWSQTIAEQMGQKGRRVAPVAVGRRNNNGIFAKAGALYRAAGSTKICVADLSGVETLKGAHNWQNAAVAFAIASALGLSDQEIASGMRSFPGLPHRLQVVARAGNIVFVNDSKATNADAAARALAAYDDVIWIAGGVPKSGGISGLHSYFPRVRQAFLIGEAAPKFAQTLDGHVPHHQVADLEAAIRAAYNSARAQGGGTILLSPACASFDQFENFEQRGEAFADLANMLLNEDRPSRRAGAAR